MRTFGSLALKTGDAANAAEGRMRPPLRGEWLVMLRGCGVARAVRQGKRYRRLKPAASAARYPAIP